MLRFMYAYTYVLMNVFSLLLDLLAARRFTDRQKDIEILLLCHQLRILQRHLCEVLLAARIFWAA
jgi:hypothetical protein